MKKEFDAEQAFDKMFKYMQEFRTEINDRFDGEIGRIDKRLDTLQNSMDYLVGEYQKLSDEGVADVNAHRRFGDALDNHETRIDRLEKLDLKKQAA